VTATRDEAARRIVTERLLGSVRSLGPLPGGYSGGSVYRVRARLGGGERDLAVKLGRVKGAPEVADGDATARVYGARSWSHAPTHALLRARGLPVYDVLGEAFPTADLPFFWVAMSWLEGVDVRGHDETDAEERASFFRCCGEALGALHAVTRAHDGPADRATPYRTGWTDSFFASLEAETQKGLALGSAVLREHERALRGWVEARRRSWAEPSRYSLSQMDGLQGIARRGPRGWVYRGHVDLEDYSFMDARFPLAGFELAAEGIRGLKPVPQAFYAGYRSRCPIEPSFPRARDVFKLYYLLSWLYIPYDSGYHASAEAQRKSIERHETAILQLIRGERSPVAP
jgi:Phosphotransferase enzyme family